MISKKPVFFSNIAIVNKLSFCCLSYPEIYFTTEFGVPLYDGSRSSNYCVFSSATTSHNDS